MVTSRADPRAGDPETTAIDRRCSRGCSPTSSGVHPAGARLPAERELARQLGASRPTLREALRRLGEWNLVEPRRGSGIVVRPYRDWSIEVLAAYLRYGKPEAGQPSIGRILIDMLAMRRAVVLEVIRLTASRDPQGRHRSGARSRWRARGRCAISRRTRARTSRSCAQIAEAAQFTPGLWLLNRIAELWLDAAATLRFAVRPPDDYVAVHTRFFDLIEDGEGDAACALMDDYLERHDGQITDALEVVA